MMPASARPPGMPDLPDLTGLSSDEKDRLIVSLYETLLAVEGGVPSTPRDDNASSAPRAQAAAGRMVTDLKVRIAGSAPSRRSQTIRNDVPRTFARLIASRPLQLLLVLLGVGFAVDFAIGWYERQALDQARLIALQLRSAAFDSLYVELVRVVYEPDGHSYRATITLQKTRDNAPLYVMMSPMRVFVQVGLTWQEVPARAPPGTGWGVVKLDDSRDVAVVFEADLKHWAELIPGYMHVRIDSQMLISRSTTPKDDIVERNNVFYVYLKPQAADDEAIKQKSRFPGKPPVFIPMPPH